MSEDEDHAFITPALDGSEW